jgi:lysophospholipase L1-like esterase
MKWTIKTILVGAVFASLLSPRPARAASDGSLGDSNLKYIGRWDLNNSSQYSAYWGGAYVKTRFSGTTLKFKVASYGGASDYYVRIDDGAWTAYRRVTGTVNATPTPLANGVHSVVLAQGRDYDYEFNFQGFVLDSGATTSPPTVANNLIEFIGDSITAGYTDPNEAIDDYAWVCAENLNGEHVQVAYPGIKLVSISGGMGMDVSYFNLKTMNYANSPAWDFSKYTPRVIVINLGQNDGTGVPDSAFQSTYTTFLATIRTRFPNAEIFAMRTFLGIKAAPAQAAVNARIAAGDSHVHYVDTTGWLISGTSDYNDGVHPSPSGHVKAAGFLQPILAPYVNGEGPANGTYKIINRSSGQALDAKGQVTADGTAIQQWTYNGGNNQRWAVTALGGGQYEITGVQSGKPLDVRGQSTANGAAIQLWTNNGGNNQKWVITPASGGYYTVQGVQSGKLMEVVGQSASAGALVDQWSNSGGSHQQWSFQAP